MSNAKDSTADPNVSEKFGPNGDLRLERFLPALITWAAHRLAANNSIVYRDKFDVTLTEWRVMLHLTAEPGSSAAQLAHAIGYDKASISRTVGSLAQRGLLCERAHASDGRALHLDLTEQGEKLYREILPVALEQETRLLAGLSLEESETLVDLMGRVVVSLRSDGRQIQRRAPTRGVDRRRARSAPDAS